VVVEIPASGVGDVCTSASSTARRAGVETREPVGVGECNAASSSLTAGGT
jgi:hypothetical protein